MNRDIQPPQFDRRTLLQRAGIASVLWAGSALVGCSDQPIRPPASSPTTPANSSPTTGSVRGMDAASTSQPASATNDGPSVLVAYFSRAGENYYNGGRTLLEVGNTEVVANLIQATLSVDVYRIEAADPYPDSYDETVARNVGEQDADARPALANPAPDVGDYDTVLLGSGIWNVRPPMIMSTFLDNVDLTGKRLAPFVTYAVSGLGRTIDVYTDLAPGATITDGLAVRGEEAVDATDDVRAWLRRLELLDG